MNGASFLPSRCGVLPDKIQRRHRERAAMVYVRQSTVQQIERNQESTRLQYALVDRAFQFGWARESIVVIDDDLGHSGATIEGRLGFQRLVAEVGLGHVGLVLGVEMSRLARSCRDWHQLLEICALFDALIADADGVYDPSSYNDRLLLGLKGTMSEAELHILKARMLEGRRAKARREWRAIDRPPAAEARPIWYWSASVPYRGCRGFPSRPSARLYQLGAISTQSIAAKIEQGDRHRGSARRAGFAVRDADLRSLRPADGGAIQQQWSACPLLVHPHGM
jgi:DNA invertase Pin-like site-specific DNA recombinase